MWTAVALLEAFVLFALGVRLSAFFSGNETGFYRVSFLRLTIDAQAGDRTARRLLWFSQNPSYFVATTLVGNNVANYLATFAIGIAAVALYPAHSGWLEIVATLLVAPVIFIFGELVPKNLYYRAPLSLLRKDARWFVLFYRLFLVASWPLIGVTKLIERLGRSESPQLEIVLGRNRLTQVLSQGHREGLLSEVQSRLIHGLMHTATQPVTDSMTPANRVLGVPETASREEVLAFAKQYGLSSVAVRRSDAAEAWYGYLRVIDVAVYRRPLRALIRPLPRVDRGSSKLEAVLALRSSGEAYGAIIDGPNVLGIISERGLIEQFFRPPQPISPRPR